MGIWRYAQALLQQEERWAQEPRQPRGVPTGFSSLDALTLGLRPREVTLLAARTSHGKSALALTIAVNVVKWEILRSFREGRKPGRVLYLSPEMHPEQLLMRLASGESRVELELVMEGLLQPEQRRRWREVLKALHSLDSYFIIEGGQGMDINDVESLVRSYHAESPLVLVVIDYLQRLTYGMVDEDHRRYSLISQTIKDLANQIAVPFLVVSQLNRQIERDRHQMDRLPDLSDLRGSGRLEEDADNVWILWRPPRLTTESTTSPQSAKLMVAKSRSGRVGEVELWFYSRYVTFAEAGAGRVRADGGIAIHSVAGEPLPSIVELAQMLRGDPHPPDDPPPLKHPPQPVDESHDDDEGDDSAPAQPREEGKQQASAVSGVLDRLDALADLFRNWPGPSGIGGPEGNGSGQAAPESGAHSGSHPPAADAVIGESPIAETAVSRPLVAGATGGWSPPPVTEEGVTFGCREWRPRQGSSEKREDLPEAEDGEPVSLRAPPKGRRRGADFEKRLARRLGAFRWPGLDGDIETPQGWRLECKYREGLVLNSRDELRSWLEQVYDYAAKWPSGKRWALAITGGQRYRRGQIYILLPLEFWWELVCGT